MGYIQNASLITLAPAMPRRFAALGNLPHSIASYSWLSSGTGTLELFAIRLEHQTAALQLRTYSMGNTVIQQRLLAVTALLVLLSGCGAGKKDEAAAPSPAAAVAGTPGQSGVPVGVPPPVPVKSATPLDQATGERVYRNTCSLCHRIGVKGAPRLGDAKDWALRLAQGNEVLYNRAINGYRGSKGSMPSRGSNAKLSTDEVRAAVDYMVRYSVPKPHGSLGSHLFSATTKQFTIR